MKATLPLTILAALCAAVAAQPSILDIALASGDGPDGDLTDFDLLVRSIQTAGLVDSVTALENATLFAPNDEAFVRTAEALGFEGEGEEAAFGFLVEAFTDLGDGDPIPVLTNVLLYHISPTVLSSEDVLQSELIDTLLESGNIRHTPGELALKDNAPSIRNPRLIEGSLDIQASNGVVHVINRVLIPVRLTPENDNMTSAPESTSAPATGSILDIALASGGEFDDDSSDFDLLVQSVQTAGLVDAVAGLSDATLFAPNDNAFIQTAEALGFSGEGEENAFNFLVEAFTGLGDGDPIPVLTNVLLYHISSMVLSSSDVLASESIDTLLENATIRHNVDSLALIDNAPSLRNPRLVEDKIDIEATNGVVHVIDRVLIPVRVNAAPVMSAEPSSDGTSETPSDGEGSDADDVVSDGDDDVESGDEDATEGPGETDEEDDDDDVCFPAAAEVTMMDGSYRQLGELKIGDVIRTGPGSADFNTVFFFSHKDASAVATFVRVTLASGSSVRLSPSHMVQLANGRLVASRDVVVGDMLIDASGQRSPVRRLERVSERGLFAPHTLSNSGTLVVDGVIVSEFTTAVHPALARTLLAPIKFAFRHGLQRFAKVPQMLYSVKWSKILGSQGLLTKRLMM